MTTIDGPFWSLVERVTCASDGTSAAIGEALRSELANLTPATIRRHHRAFLDAVWSLHDHAVADAASLAVDAGWLSDDGFVYLVRVPGARGVRRRAC